MIIRLPYSTARVRPLPPPSLGLVECDYKYDLHRELYRRNYKLRRNAFTPLGLFIQRFNTQLLDLYMSFFGRLKYSRF